MLMVRLLFSFVRVHHLLAFRVLSYLPSEQRRLSLSFPFNALRHFAVCCFLFSFTVVYLI